MSEERTVKGFWWHPDTPDERWFGVLEQKTRANIRLTCHAEANTFTPLAESSGVTIHGRNEQGTPVTLFVVSRTRKTISGGMTTLQLHPGYVLEGIHLADKDSFKALAVDFRLQHLYGWLGITGFDPRVSANASGKVTISYKRPDQTCHEVGADTKVEFGLLTKYVCSVQERSIDEEATISISHEVGLTFSTCREMIAAFRSLLHFAILKPVYAVGMTFRGFAGQEQPDERPPHEVVVWSGNWHEPKTEYSAEPVWIFRYSDVATNFGTFFAKWLNYRLQYDEPLDCYTTTVYHPLPTPVEHLCLTQALDAYHGVRHASHARRDFKAKVEELCEQHQDALSWLVSDTSSFATQVRDTRDYHTHHNPKDLATRDVVLGTTSLRRLNEKLAVLFQSCVLQDMGIPEERLRRLHRQMASDIVEY